MRIELERYSLRIIPEDNVSDLVYIEEVLGLKQDGDSIKLIRHNAHEVNRIACLETERMTKHD